MENVETKICAEEEANKQQANSATKSGKLRKWSYQVPLKLKGRAKTRIGWKSVKGANPLLYPVWTGIHLPFPQPSRT